MPFSRQEMIQQSSCHTIYHILVHMKCTFTACLQHVHARTPSI
jgi:hypothetical protein